MSEFGQGLPEIGSRILPVAEAISAVTGNPGKIIEMGGNRLGEAGTVQVVSQQRSRFDGHRPGQLLAGINRNGGSKDREQWQDKDEYEISEHIY